MDVEVRILSWALNKKDSEQISSESFFLCDIRFRELLDRTPGKQKRTRNQSGAGPFCMHDLLKTPGRAEPDQGGMVYLFHFDLAIVTPVVFVVVTIVVMSVVAIIVKTIVTIIVVLVVGFVVTVLVVVVRRGVIRHRTVCVEQPGVSTVVTIHSRIVGSEQRPAIQVAAVVA